MKSNINLISILKEYFHLDDFRPLQKKVVEHVLQHKSALVLMPTGSGKSLIYQLPSVLGEGTVLVISPLKALMKDQVDKLQQLKIRASFVNSDVSKNEREKRLQSLAYGEYQIFYVTPERFRKTDFVEIIRKVNIKLLVVDEAHCISQWGHDFRPEYAKIGQFYKLLSGRPILADKTSAAVLPPVLALTATATSQVRDDILNTLNINKDNLFALPITRSNLGIRVHDLYGFEEKVRLTLPDKLNSRGSQIFYFSLIQSLHNFSRQLQKLKIPHETYHSQMPEPLKRKAQESFLRGHCSLMLATPAFGLGIDKADVGAVVHVEVPGSLEAYYQEIGRAGRDGAPAQCVLLYDQEDVSTQMEFIKWSHPEGTFIQKIYELIKKNPERVRQEGADYLREQMNFYNKRDFRVETAINLLTSWDVIAGWDIIADLSLDWLHEVYNEANRSLRLKRQNEKLLQMVQFVSTLDCRMQYIHKYFSEPDIAPCGVCDNCLGR